MDQPQRASISSQRSALGQMLAAAKGLGSDTRASTAKQFYRTLAFSIVEWNPKSSALPPGHGACVSARIDGEEVARTRLLTDDRPFWNESFLLKIPEDLEQVAFYLHRRPADKRLVSNRSTNPALAKLDLDKQQLIDRSPIDEWLPLQDMRVVDDVSGKINLDVEIVRASALRDLDLIRFNRKALMDHAEVDIDNDPFVVSMLLLGGAAFTATGLFVMITIEPNAVSGDVWHSPDRPPMAADLFFKSRVFRRNCDPVWCESVVLATLPQPNIVEPDPLTGEPVSIAWKHRGTAPVIKLSVWQEGTEGEKDVLIGKTIVPLGDEHLPLQRLDRVHALNLGDSADIGTLAEWYSLESTEHQASSESGEVDATFGSLRLKVDLKELRTLPDDSYEPIKAMLLSSLEGDFGSSPVMHLAKMTSDKEQLARQLIRAYEYLDQDVNFVIEAAEHEIAQCVESATLFRGNTLASKAVDQYLKIHGTNLLWSTLSPVLNEILTLELHLEINPAMGIDEDVVAQNTRELENYVTRATIDMVSSASMAGDDIKVIFAAIAQAAAKQFPDEPNVSLTAVSGFIFLRFYAAAILNPQLFGLCQLAPPAGVKRTLTLVSKAVQSLGNLGGDLALKEQYMVALLEELQRKHGSRVQLFLKGISTSSVPKTTARRQSSTYRSQASGQYLAVIKEGFLVKRGMGRRKSVMGMSLNGLKNLKKRFFVLSNEGLSYQKQKGEPALGQFLPRDIVGVERVDAAALAVEHAFQVLLLDSQPLYVAASSDIDCSEWMMALRRYSERNLGLAPSYHPGIFGSGGWSCCKQSKEDSSGCRPCTRDFSERYPRMRATDFQPPAVVMEDLFRMAIVAKTAGENDERVAKDGSARKQMLSAIDAMINEHTRRKPPMVRQGSKFRPHSGLKRPSSSSLKLLEAPVEES